MVERKASEGLTSFDGIVESVELQPATDSQFSDQYKVTIKTAVSKKSGYMYEWVPISPTSSDEEVAEDSNMDKYLKHVERCIPEAKQSKTVGEALKLMVGKNINFVRETLGRAFKGNPAREFWVPSKIVDSSATGDEAEDNTEEKAE